jgi:hypothetical protein
MNVKAVTDQFVSFSVCKIIRVKSISRVYIHACNADNYPLCTTAVACLRQRSMAQMKPYPTKFPNRKYMLYMLCYTQYRTTNKNFVGGDHSR